jgi:hypothetical protein
MSNAVGKSLLSTLAIFSTAMAEVPLQERASIDRVIGVHGVYILDDGVYKIILPREDATLVQNYQTLSPNLGINSWVAFRSAAHGDAIVIGQFLLLDDEIDSVLSAALDAGLEVTGLAAASMFAGPALHMLDITGTGTFQDLAAGFRKGIDEIRHVRRDLRRKDPKWKWREPPLESAIDRAPLDLVLSVRGTVVGGAYRAAIGKMALIRGEPVGREMGMNTWMSFSGTNDNSVVHGEFVETADNLQKVLRALRARGMSIEAIRNHTLGEHPQYVFVRYWGEGKALDLAKALRYVLDVEVGAIGSGAKLRAEES